MQSIHYCKGWFRAKKSPLESYSEEKALALHNDGKPYCALVGPRESPLCFLEVTKDFVGVGFLDSLLRENLSYSFQVKEDGRLFLSMATWREYIDQTDTVTKGTSYIFEPSGAVSVRIETLHPEHQLSESKQTVSVASNWDSFPSFGKYSSLIRIER